MALAFLLIACQGRKVVESRIIVTHQAFNVNTVSQDEKNQKWLPDSIKKIIDYQDYVDANIHILTSGKLKINSETIDCVIPPQINPNVKYLYRGFYGIGPGRHGRINEKMNDKKGGIRICEDDGENQITYFSLSSPNPNAAYRLVIAVWQGDSFWIGIIEREIKNLHPKPRGIALPLHGEPHPQSEIIRGSLNADIYDMSIAFDNYINGESI